MSRSPVFQKKDATLPLTANLFMIGFVHTAARPTPGSTITGSKCFETHRCAASTWFFASRKRAMIARIAVEWQHFFGHLKKSVQKSVAIPIFNPIPRPFPIMRKCAALEDMLPPRRWEITQLVLPVKGNPPINGGADAPLTDSFRLFWTICGVGGYITRAIFERKWFWTICPEVRKKIAPVIQLGVIHTQLSIAF